jgi:RNA polymerase sporulation-specific sigma factor
MKTLQVNLPTNNPIHQARQGGEESAMPQQGEEVLLDKAAQGDQLAIETLLIRYKNLVRYKAAAMHMAGAEAEDVIQEGMIGLYKAIRDYRPVFQVPFAAFASYCVMAQITDAVRRASRKKHGPLNESLSLQGLIQTEDDGEASLLNLFAAKDEPGPEETLLNREQLVGLLLFIQNELSKLERQAVLLFIQKLSYQQIADCLACSVKKVDNALNRARQKFLLYRQKEK